MSYRNVLRAILLILLLVLPQAVLAAAIEKSQFNAMERVTGGNAVITTDHAYIHDGISFTAAGTLTIATATTGGLFIVPPAAAAATTTVDMTSVASDLTYTAIAAGPDGNNINITHVNPAANSAPLTVTVFVTSITVSLATNESGTITSTAAQVKSAVNANAAAAALVLCEDEGTGSGVVNAANKVFLTGGVNALYCHFKAAALHSTAAVTASLLEGYVKAGGDTVSTVTPMNRNRNISAASRITLTGGTSITPTQGPTYATLATTGIGANTPSNKVGGDVSQAEEWVLKPGTSYCIAVANASGGNALVSYDLLWYEESGH